MFNQHRSVQRYNKQKADEQALTEAVTSYALKYGRFGYRRVKALLNINGWHVNHKRVERVWRHEGLNVPAKQP